MRPFNPPHKQLGFAGIGSAFKKLQKKIDPINTKINKEQSRGFKRIMGLDRKRRDDSVNSNRTGFDDIRNERERRQAQARAQVRRLAG